MKKFIFLSILTFALSSGFAQEKPHSVCQDSDEGFVYEADRFADIRILRYRIPCFDQLSTKQKALVYYLTQAGLAGRDIMWAQNGQYNLDIRNVCEKIYTQYQGETKNTEWLAFETYLKQLWMIEMWTCVWTNIGLGRRMQSPVNIALNHLAT